MSLGFRYNTSMSPEVGSVGPFVEKICTSPGFRRSPRLQRFLRYVLQWASEAPGQPLKEYSIAVAVYDKSTSFDPQSDPIIRVEAGRLRSRLLEYYAGAGREDALVIEMPRGSYLPAIRMRPKDQPSSAGESIAVIAWNEGSDPDLEYLSDGISEGVTSRLARIPNLRVAPWNMALRSKPVAQDFSSVARLLGVRTLLILRLTARGESYRVHAEWLDPEHKAHLWGAKYDRQLAELHSVEDEVTLDLAERIMPHLSAQQRSEIRKQHTNSGRAYHLYLKGRYLWNKRTSEAMMKAIQYYRRALDEDPGFAPAFAGIADSYFVLGTFGFLSPADTMPGAKAAAVRALELDEDLGEAHATLAAIRAVWEWEWRDSEAGFRRAIELAPKHAPAFQWYGFTLCSVGRFAAGLKLLKHALDLDPLSPMITTQLAAGYYIERRYADAIRTCKSVLDSDAQFWPALLFLGQSLEQVGQLDDALCQLRAAVEFSAGNHVASAALGHASARAGDGETARMLLSQLETRSAAGYVPPYSLALICSGLGSRDAALGYLEQAHAEPSPSIGLWLRGEPRLDWLRGDARFRNLLRNARLIEELN